jgi:hypothetical protein
MRESVCGNMIHCDTLLKCNTMHYKNIVYVCYRRRVTQYNTKK